MSAATDYRENRSVDGLFRRGITAWAASTAYAAGQMVYGTNATAYGKVMVCTTAGTTGATQPASWPTPSDVTPATQADGTATWTVWYVGDYSPGLWMALFTAAPSDAGGGTESTYTGYARVAYAPSLTNWVATNGGAGNPSSGTSGTTANANPVNFPTPAGAGAVCTHLGVFDAPTGGNLLYWGALAQSITPANGVPISFAAGQLTFQVDN